MAWRVKGNHSEPLGEQGRPCAVHGRATVDEGNVFISFALTLWSGCQGHKAGFYDSVLCVSVIPRIGISTALQ